MRIQGIIPPIVTPLDERERVDEKSLRGLARQLLNAGVDGIFVLGSTGEFAHLQDDEKRKAMEIVIEEVGKVVPVLVGVTETGTRRAVRWSHEAESRGADALVAAPPFYFPLSELEVERFYRTLAGETNLPLLIYHIPSTTKISMTISLFQTLSEVPNIVGVKDSTGKLPFTFRLIDAFRGRDFVILQGDDALVAPTLLYGGHGAINSSANLVPEWFVRLYGAVRDGDEKEAFSWQQRINRLLRELEGFPFLPALKEGLWYRGLIMTPIPTAPFSPLTESQRRRVHEILRHMGVVSEG